MLAIKITATPDAVNIDGIIPLEPKSTQSSDSSSNLLTTGQTWGCMLTHNKNHRAEAAVNLTV